MSIDLGSRSTSVFRRLAIRIRSAIAEPLFNEQLVVKRHCTLSIQEISRDRLLPKITSPLTGLPHSGLNCMHKLDFGHR